jgi:hypothetical protein
MRLKITDNLAKVEADLDAWAAGIKDAAVPRALNTLRDQAKTAGFRQVAQVYQISAKTLDGYTTLKAANAGDPQAAIVVKGKGFPLSVFKPIKVAGRGGGVSVLIKGKRILIPHAFMIPKAGQHVFARGSYGGKYGGSPTGQAFGRYTFTKQRLPIGELYSFAPPDCLSNASVREAMDDRVTQQAADVLARSISAARRGF